MRTIIQQTFLLLVRQGIGHGGVLPDVVDWPAIQALANEQGLAAVVIDSVERLPAWNRPPKMLLLQWIGDVLQGYENRYDLYRQAIVELAGFYNAHGFKMMVLKGYACSLDWPKPKHRPCGDIDIWLFGKQKEVDDLLAKEKGIKVDVSHHHHTVFFWQGFSVENHYDFVNVHSQKSSAKLEKIFKRLGEDDSHFVEVMGEKVYIPSPDLHALFLIRHMACHFAASGITVRQVLDWAFFAEKHCKEVNWEWLVRLLEEYHMKDFFHVINAICVEDLGFSPSIFPMARILPGVKERVLDDILEPEYPSKMPKNLLKRLVYKWQRWQGNAWKQEMCYGESRWSMFWTGIWAKILKPASI